MMTSSRRRQEDDMTEPATHGPGARPGDWIEISGRPGKPPRRGEVLEVLGEVGHERYRVRWEDRHESVLFPTEAVRVLQDHGGPGG